MSRNRGPSPFDKLLNYVFGKPAQIEQAPAPKPVAPVAPQIPTKLAQLPPVKSEAKRPKPASPVPAPATPSKGTKRSGKSLAQKAETKPLHRHGYAPPVGRLTPKLSLKPKAPPAPKPSGPEHLTGPKALHYVLDRVDLGALNGAAPAQTAVSAKTSAKVDRIVARGAQILTEKPSPDPMGYRIGLDFGTSTTKVVLCSDAADVDYALETPTELQVEENGRRQQHLWRTCVWFNDATQCFQLTPSKASRPILGFKTGLIQGNGNRMLVAGISHNAAAAAYLALLIAYIVGADAERIAVAGGAERHYSRFHIGVPVPSLEEDARVAGFHRVVQAAFVLAPHAAALRLEDVKAALQRELGPTDTTTETPYQLFEELAGVVAGYMLTPEKAGGPHIIVDVGAATLDVATFHIPDGEHPLEVYESGVELLGAQALECAISMGVPEPTFRAACQAHTHGVLSRTFRTKNYSFLPGEGGPTKPMIYVGGGRMTKLHQSTYEGYARAYLAPMRSPGVGRWLERSFATDQERLLLAWGLAQDPGTDAIPRIRPPSTVVPTLQRQRDWQGSYAGAEVC
jgi:hypothetical protein